MLSELLVYVNGQLVPRSEAQVSVFDAGFQSGDGTWEGLRIYHGRVFELDAHMNRLCDSAKALSMEVPLSRPQLDDALFETLRANELYHDAHVRLMVSRGERRTSGMDPTFVEGRPGTVVIIAEHKPPIFDKNGVRLVASSVRRPSPDTLEPRAGTGTPLVPHPGQHDHLHRRRCARARAVGLLRRTRRCQRARAALDLRGGLRLHSPTAAVYRAPETQPGAVHPAVRCRDPRTSPFSRPF